MSSTVPLLFLTMTVIIGVVLAVRRTLRERSLQEEVDSAEVMRLHAEGKVDAEGRPICRVKGCERIAEDPVPFIDQPTLEKLPFIRTRNKLHAMPWRYIVRSEGEPCICAHHGLRSREQLEHFLATLRAEHSDFNAEQLSKVAVMNGGGVLEWLNRSEARVKDTISSSRSLDGTYSLPAYTSGEEGS